MAFDAHKNLAYSTVATAPSPATSGTSLIVQAGAGASFPTPPFNATIWPANTQPIPSNSEIVRVTGISTDTLTIVRIQESTSARSVVIGDQIAATITAKTITDIESGGLLSYAALLATIFSSQVQSQANAGTAGGTIYWLNLGGVKIMWAVGASQSTGTGWGSFGFTLPTFFTTVDMAVGGPFNVGGVGQQAGNATCSTTAASVFLGTFLSSGTALPVFIAIGT